MSPTPARPAATICNVPPFIPRLSPAIDALSYTGRSPLGGLQKSRYAHLFPEHGEALADRLAHFITTSTPTPAAPVVHMRPA